MPWRRPWRILRGDVPLRHTGQRYQEIDAFKLELRASMRGNTSLRPPQPHREYVRSSQGLAARHYLAHDKCPKIFLFAVALAAAVLFRL